MKDKMLTLKISEAERDHYTRHLGYVRCWINGFEAASGKKGPHVADSLRLIQLRLGEAK